MVLKLKKALYGLPQAPPSRAWNSNLDRSLTSLRLEKSSLEHAVYKRSTGESRILVGFYVDDLIVIGSDD